MPLARKKLRDQGVLELKGVASAGFYVELQPLDSHPGPVYRRLRNTAWDDRYILHDASAGCWKVVEAPWLLQHPLAWSSASDAAATAAAAEAWCSRDAAEGAAEISVQAKTVMDLPLEGRKVARAIFKEPQEVTRWRCRASKCPGDCNNEGASAWGLESECMLYGHLCLYHRNSEEYYEMNRRLWDQGVADALAQRTESAEDLFAAFEKMMRDHKYEKKALNRKVQHHRRNIEVVLRRLEVPLSRRLADDPDMYERLSMLPEEISEHGHYSTSMRWFKKFVEVSAIEEILSAAPDIEEVEVARTPQRAPQASASNSGAAAGNGATAASSEKQRNKESGAARKKRTLEAAADEEEAAFWKYALGEDEGTDDVEVIPVPEKPKAEKRPAIPDSISQAKAGKRSRLDPGLAKVRRVPEVQRAADPFAAVVRLQDTVARTREHRHGEQHSRSSSSRPPAAHWDGKENAAPRDEEERVCADLIACVARGSREVAEQVATWEENSGPAASLLRGLPKSLKVCSLDALSQEEADHCWLWAYCGVRPREALLDALADAALQPPRDDARFSELLRRLACTARSPHAEPVDVLELMERLFSRLPAQSEFCQWSTLGKFAGKAFVLPRHTACELLDVKWPRPVRMIALGALLAMDFSNWGGLAEHVDAWWGRFRQRSTAAAQPEWLCRLAFASSFYWNHKPELAKAALEEFIDSCWQQDQRQRGEAMNLQALAFKKSQEASRARPRAMPSGQQPAEVAVPPEPARPSPPATVAGGGEGRPVDAAASERRRGGVEEGPGAARPQPPPSAPLIGDGPVQGAARPQAPVQPSAAAPSDTLAGLEATSTAAAGAVVNTPSPGGTAGLTAEQLARIQRNREAAMEKRRLLREGSCPDAETVAVDASPAGAAATAPDSAVAAPRPPATSAASAVPSVPATFPRGASEGRLLEERAAQPASHGPATAEANGALPIMELGRPGAAAHARGTVSWRSDHRTGSGFHVRIKDDTGEIDLKFWNGEADAFRSHPGLVKGAVIVVRNYRVHKLSTARQREMAPAGRDIELVAQPGVVIEVASPPAQPPVQRNVSVQDALRNPHDTRLDSVTGYAVDVLDEEMIPTRSGSRMPMRSIKLAASLEAPQAEWVRWVLWGDLAKEYGPKQLAGQKLRLRGVKVKQPPLAVGGKELTGCWRHGGIEVLPHDAGG